MSKIINFDKYSQEESDDAATLWDQKVKDQILGKTITFTGMKWHQRGHAWVSYTVRVQKVLPNRSGNPFNPEIEILGEDGENYTIHPEYDLVILG
jgi:hypothetical protein